MKKKTVIYPSKTALNLCVKEESQFAPKKLLPLLLALLILAVLFGKFAVADLYSAMYSAQAQVSALAAEKTRLAEATVGYDELQAEYDRYSTSWMTAEEVLSVKRTEMLELIEAEFMPTCQVQNIVAAGNILSVQLGGITLDDVSGFVQTLYERSDVDNVSVYTASTDTQGGEGSVVSMVISMSQVIEGGAVG